MPRKPKKPCARVGCPNLTEGRYCEEHQKQVNSAYERFGRNKEHKRYYGTAWKRIRDRHVRENPFCEMCRKEGRLVMVEQVHHIVPLAEGGTHDRSNLMSLCKACHNKVHNERGDKGINFY